MGSWSVYCSISKIAITAGNDCVLIPLKLCRHTQMEEYLPATLPIFGTYDDYGGIEDIIKDDNTKYIEEYFNCKIDQFCEYFTRGCIRDDEDGFPKFLKDKLKGWSFTFIDRNVYDFISQFSPKGYAGSGDFDYGDSGLLKWLGFEFVGESADSRYNQLWKYNDVTVESDGTWLKDNIYSFEDLDEIMQIPEDKRWIKDKSSSQIWRVLSKKKQLEYLCVGIGVDYRDATFIDLSKRFKIENESETSYVTQCKERMVFQNHYINNLEIFGDRIAELVMIRKNMYSMSSRFEPHILYVTPQCGDYRNHQILLEKFAEINKTYIQDDDE